MEVKLGLKCVKYRTSLPQLSNSIVRIQLYMDFLTVLEEVKFFICPRCNNDIIASLDNIRHQIIWVLVVLASFIGASFFLREAIDDWIENRTGCLKLS